MTSSKLIDEYRELNPTFKKLYVVPLINYHIKNTDYLWLLYQPVLNDPSITLINLSVFSHFKLLSPGVKDSILHYHWFEVKDFKSLLGMFWKLFWILLYKLFGGKVIWTVHNKYPHAGNYINLNKSIRRYFAKKADKLHVHCNYAAEIMKDILGADRNKFFVVEHPAYPAMLLDKLDSLKNLKEKYSLTNLNEHGRIFLSFGSIAPYKGIEGLIKIFKELKPEDILLIAGGIKKGAEEYYHQLLNQAQNTPNIIFIPSIIADGDVPFFFNASDYAIFNYTDILTSGAVVLALSYNKPSIAPAIGCIKEIENENLTLFESQDELRNLLINLQRKSHAR